MVCQTALYEHRLAQRERTGKGTYIQSALFENNVFLMAQAMMFESVTGERSDLAVEMAVAGVGAIQLFEEWLRPHLESGALEPVLEDWWQPFSGPFLYYSGRRLVPPALRAFIDFIKARP